jgi:hypothetical protein
MFVDFVIKSFTIILNMITNEQIAAAKLAQIFGSELLRVDTNTVEQSGQTLPATRIDPKRILTEGNDKRSSNNDAEGRLIRMLQKEAELAHPNIESPLNSNEQTSGNSEPISTEQHFVPQQHGSFIADPCLIKIFEQINSNLSRIANNLDKADVSVRRKITKIAE